MSLWHDVLKYVRPKFPQLPEEKLKLIRLIVDSPKKGNFLIPEEAPTDTSIKELADRKIVLRFDNFCEEECIFEGSNATTIKSLLNKLKAVNSFTYSDFLKSGMIRGDLDRNDNSLKSYFSLFQKIPEEHTIKEMEFLGCGRIFFFFIEEKFYIISIEMTHRNTN